MSMLDPAAPRRRAHSRTAPERRSPTRHVMSPPQSGRVGDRRSGRDPEAVRERAPRRLRNAALLLLLVVALPLTLLSGCATRTNSQVTNALHFDPPELPVPDPAGPTLKFTRSNGHVLDCPIADFMYLIPLVSPEPMSVISSPGNTQRVRMTLKKTPGDPRFVPR